jgi:thioredoxin reductase
VRLTTGEIVAARRVLLCTGMIDELPEIEGLRALWGKSIVICPYCHGWEVQDRAFGFLAPSAEFIEFPLFLRGWSNSVVALTDGRFTIPEEKRARLASANVPIEERRIARLSARDEHLDRVEFEEGSPLRLDVLFVRPPQRQVPLVQSLVQSAGLALNSAGFVELNEHRQTSVPGVYAGGDLVSGMQSAIISAASGAQAAAMLNHELTVELSMTMAQR